MATRPTQPDRQFLSASGVARTLGVCTKTILTRVAQGHILPDAMSGRTMLIDASRIDRIRELLHRKPEILA